MDPSRVAVMCVELEHDQAPQQEHDWHHDDSHQSLLRQLIVQLLFLAAAVQRACVIVLDRGYCAEIRII